MRVAGLRADEDGRVGLADVGLDVRRLDEVGCQDADVAGVLDGAVVVRRYVLCAAELEEEEMVAWWVTWRQAGCGAAGKYRSRGDKGTW